MASTSSAEAPPKFLLVVDVQSCFFEPFNPVPGSKVLLERIGRVVEMARKAEPPVKIIWVRHGDSDDAELTPNTPSWEIASPLNPDTSNGEPILEKTEPDSFIGTKLASMIAAYHNWFSSEHNIEPHFASTVDANLAPDLTIVGLQSDFCIRATSTSAKKRYPEGKVKVISGCHGTYGNEETGQSAEEVVREMEEEMRAKGVEIVGVEGVGF